MADEEKKEKESTETPAEEKVEEKEEGTAEEKTEEKIEEKPAEEPKEEPKKEEKPAEEPKKTASPAVREPKKEKPAPSGKYKDLIKEIESMSVSDLAELVKALEERFGVSAASPVAAAGAPAAGGTAAPEAEEKVNFTIMLKDGGAQKIAVIKAVREINQDLGLKEAKDLVDGAPKEIKKEVPKTEAEEAKKKLEAAGATAELV